MVVGVDHLSSVMTAGQPFIHQPNEMNRFQGFVSSSEVLNLEAPSPRPPASHLSAARLYLNLPRRSGPTEKEERGRDVESTDKTMDPLAHTISSSSTSRNRSATVSDPAEIRATSPHLRSTFDRARQDSLSMSGQNRDKSSSSPSRSIIDLDGTGPSGWSSPQPLPSPVPTDHQGVDPLGRSPSREDGNSPQHSAVNPSLSSVPTSQTTKISSPKSAKDLAGSSKTSAFFSASFKLDLPTPPRPLAEPSYVPPTVDLSSSPNRLSPSPSFPVHSTSRSAHYRLPSERLAEKSAFASSNLNRARSLNSAARPIASEFTPASISTSTPQASSSRSSAFFSTSFAATPPRAPSPPRHSQPSTSPSRTGKDMVSSGIPLGLGRSNAIHGKGPGNKENSRSVTMPVSSLTSSPIRESGPTNGSFVSGIGAGPVVQTVPVSPATPSPMSTTFDPAGIISPPRKLTREVSGTFRPGTLVKEQEEPARVVKSGDILIAPEAESVPRLAQPESPVYGSNPLSHGDPSKGIRYWQVERVMGEGAFSRVWSARRVVKLERIKPSSSTLLVPVNRMNGREEKDEGTYEPVDDEVVAIKMMDKRMCKENDRTRISFVREVAVLRHLSHPHIVAYLSSFSTTYYHCLVLENLSGGELFDLLQTPGNHRRMGEDLIRRIFGELCRGVYWLHEAKVVHRDLKLENIMFTVNPFALADRSDSQARIPIDQLPTPLVKLTDFGLARFIDTESPLLQTRCGSESFTAPEIIMGNPYDGRDTDSWAVGVILFALVTGELPFDRVTSATAFDEEAQRRKRIMAIAKGDYKWPVGVGSEGAKKVVARLLTRDPRKRTRVGPALWDEIWMHGPGNVPCPPKRGPGNQEETLPDGRIRLLDGFLFNKDIEMEAARDTF